LNERRDLSCRGVRVCWAGVTRVENIRRETRWDFQKEKVSFLFCMVNDMLLSLLVTSYKNKSTITARLTWEKRGRQMTWSQRTGNST
jgi:hypothetical protein